MRYKTWITGLLVLSVTGCSNMNNTQTDAAARRRRRGWRHGAGDAR